MLQRTLSCVLKAVMTKTLVVKVCIGFLLDTLTFTVGSFPAILFETCIWLFGQLSALCLQTRVLLLLHESGCNKGHDNVRNSSRYKDITGRRLSSSNASPSHMKTMISMNHRSQSQMWECKRNGLCGDEWWRKMQWGWSMMSVREMFIFGVESKSSSSSGVVHTYALTWQPADTLRPHKIPARFERQPTRALICPNIHPPHTRKRFPKNCQEGKGGWGCTTTVRAFRFSDRVELTRQRI
jgi:hypothetical protein